MQRLIIHAGFPKTGSSSIQHAIGHHIEPLGKQNVFMFGKNMQIEVDGDHPGLPLWFLEDVAKNGGPGRTLLPEIRTGFDTVASDSTLILTSENLCQNFMPPLFAGIDREVSVEIVFYMRPQTEWIPSGWKQWSLKVGITLEQFVRHCIAKNRPSYLADIQAWAEALPDARIIVRPFLREELEGGSPAVDFFSLIGFTGYDRDLLDYVVNPSLDYSLLHVMMRNASTLFEGIHDLRVETGLQNVLPARFQKTNITMLSNSLAERIVSHFREENFEILHRYTDIEDVDGFFKRYFVPDPVDGPSYVELEESDIMDRCFSILRETAGSEKSALVLAEMLGKLAKD